MVFTLVGLVSYAKSTADSSYNNTLDSFLAVLFTLDLALRWFVAESRATYLWDSPYPAIDLLCVVP